MFTRLEYPKNARGALAYKFVYNHKGRMMKRLFYILCAWIPLAGIAAPRLGISPTLEGISELPMTLDGQVQNLIDRGASLGPAVIKYRIGELTEEADTRDIPARVLFNDGDSVQLFWQLKAGIRLYQNFSLRGGEFAWEFVIFNRNNRPAEILDLSFHLPVCGVDESVAPRHNFNRHISVNRDASWFYWAPLDGYGEHVVMLPEDGTSLEYTTDDNWFFIHSSTAVDRVRDTWRQPSTTRAMKPYEKVRYAFRLFKADGRDAVAESIYGRGGVLFGFVPGMVVPEGVEASFSVRTKHDIAGISAEYPESTVISHTSDNGEYGLWKVSFGRLGENRLTVAYGDGKVCYLDFFVTRPLRELICKRAAFITSKQQHRDPSKWYNGLYSLYDMERGELLSPDYLQDLREDFMVGGSDDPSNSKPVYVSEKNVLYPDSLEIASLEYYEQHFVWGKLQRTGDEYPYPYGIYGSENWYRNRSGMDGGYDAGGSGKGRMWRTFDYTTHIAIYYNLFRIAENNPGWVHYLNAEGYLDRAYHTAMAFFEVPYNILMGEQWAFHGWCDWAYKQGNFHERYILDLIDALEERGRQEDAARLRREWEKKVTYMIYEDEWPFGSEMFVDRTAFESSYYIGEYALNTDMVPREQFWYDKNLERWYSYTEFDEAAKLEFMQKQLEANLALRGIHEPGYSRCGTAWTGNGSALDYMSQMGGVALLDYAVRFSDEPCRYVRYGYNSILSSWALMNVGDESSDYGYWHPGKDKDGAAGWAFCIFQHSHPYMQYIDIGRGPWRYDGEIDHGFTGGVHGAGIYVVWDPVFGEICYGGDMKVEGGAYKIRPYDGAGRYLAIPDAGRFELRLYNNGMDDSKEQIVARDLDRIILHVEKRGQSQSQRLSLRNLPEGEYGIRINGRNSGHFRSDGTFTDVNVGCSLDFFKIEISKTNK